MRIYKPNFWDKKNYTFFSVILLPITFFLQFLNFLKQLLQKKIKFDCPIICVGNIYIGGTGKTPVSIEICNILSHLHKNPVIIKKYYNDQFDEIELIKNSGKKIISGNTRVQAVKKAENDGYNVMILDDGYQDFSLYKNLEIVCFNSNQLIGNGLTIPSGPLRENLHSLNRCKIIIINGHKNIEFENKIKKINDKMKIYYSKYIPIKNEQLIGKNLLAFAGIGNPNNFYDLLKDCNLNVVKKISFPDHHNFSSKELEKIENIAIKNKLEIITTEKDFFRLQNMKYKKKYKDFKFLKIKLHIFDKLQLIKDIEHYIK
jgi:tetraacyldisaccharide 4'-kinase